MAVLIAYLQGIVLLVTNKQCPNCVHHGAAASKSSDTEDKYRYITCIAR